MKKKSQKFAPSNKLAKPVFVVGVTTDDRVMTTKELRPAIVTFKEYEVVKDRPEMGTEYRANIVVFEEDQRIIKHEPDVQKLIESGLCELKIVESNGKEYEIVVQAATELRLVAESESVQGYQTK